MKKKTNKAFTLIELLAVIVIFGIITGLSIPLIRRIQELNKQKKFTSYSDTLKHGAKLYMDSYEIDIFGESKSGCYVLNFEEMNQRNLLKDIEIDNISCNNTNTFVRVVKVNDRYGYFVNMFCKNMRSQKEEYSQIYYSPDTACENSDVEKIKIKINPNKHLTYTKGLNIDITLSSLTGINPNDASLEYAFSTSNDEQNIIGTWIPLKLTVMKEEEQYQKIEAGQSVETSKTISTPAGYTGDVYLLVRVLSLTDLANQDWNENYLEIKKSEQYRLDNEKPQGTIVYVNNVVENKESKSVVELQMSDTQKLASYCFKNNCNINNDSVAISGNKTEEKVTKKITEGNTYALLVKDEAGNISDKKELTFYTTILDGNGVDVDLQKITVLSGKDFALPTLTRIGYVFNGWYDSKTGDNKVADGGINYKPTSNKTLYARWTANTYQIAYTLNGGTLGTNKPNSGTYGSDIQISNPTKTITIIGDANGTGATVGPNTSKAQTFSGWTSTTVGSNAKTGTNSNPTTAWTGASTKNTFFKNLRESGTVTMIANWTAVSTKLPTLSLSGSDCAWYNTSGTSGGTKIGTSGSNYTPAANSGNEIRVYARCTRNNVTVLLDNQGASTPGTASVEAVYGNNMPTITIPAKTHTVTLNYSGSGTNTTETVTYTFGGYYAEQNGQGKRYYKPDGTSDNKWDKTTGSTLYAYWIGDGIKLPLFSGTCTKAFNGWWTASSGGTKVGDGGYTYHPNTSSTIYLRWGSTFDSNFGSDSWSTIVSNVQSGNTSRYPVGSEKSIDMGSLGCHVVRVSNNSNYNCSLPSKTACGFVIEFVDIISQHYTNPTEVNAGGWPACNMRTYVNSTIYNALPAELRNAIINTTVISSSADTSTNYTSTDKIYLLSHVEVFGSNDDLDGEFDTVTRAHTRQLDFYEQLSQDAKKKYNNGYIQWWLRSAKLTTSRMWLYITEWGGTLGTYAYIDYVGVSPAFRLKN